MRLLLLLLVMMMTIPAFADKNGDELTDSYWQIAKIAAVLVALIIAWVVSKRKGSN